MSTFKYWLGIYVSNSRACVPTFSITESGFFSMCISNRRVREFIPAHLPGTLPRDQITAPICCRRKNDEEELDSDIVTPAIYNCTLQLNQFNRFYLNGSPVTTWIFTTLFKISAFPWKAVAQLWLYEREKLWSWSMRVEHWTHSTVLYYQNVSVSTFVENSIIAEMEFLRRTKERFKLCNPVLFKPLSGHRLGLKY